MKYLAVLALFFAAPASAHECPPECTCECPCCQPAEPEPWPLGTLTPDQGVGSSDAQAIPGWPSRQFEVDGELAIPRSGWIAVRDNGAPTKLLIALTGGGGGSYWTSESTYAAALAEELIAEGFRIVQLRWKTSWWQSSLGVDAGTAHLGQRPATAIAWVVAEYGVGGEVVAAGNSAGGAQIAYALTHYGLDDLIDRAVVSGGPPFAALVGTGLGDPDYVLNDSKHHLLDRSHGYWENGPVYLHDPLLDGVDWVARWSVECIADGGLDFSYTTDLRVVQGEDDPLHAGIGQRWLDRVTSPYQIEVVPGVGHGVYESADGVNAAARHIRGQ